MPKVVMLRTRAFPPEPRGFREAKSLSKAGYDVYVLAWDRSSEHPKEERIEGISVRRFRIPSGYNDFLKFLVALPLFWLCSLIQILRLRPAVVHCADLDTMPVGALAKKILGCALVYDVYENYPEMVRGSLPDTIINVLDRLDRRLAGTADLILVVWTSFLNRYPGCVEIPNTPKIKDYELVTRKDIEETRKRFNIEGKFVLGYVGVFMKGRGIEQVIEVVKGNPDVIFLLGGFGQEEGSIRRLATDVKEVKLIGFVKPDDIPSIIRACDALVELLDPSNKNYRMAAPNKLFEAMNAGIPYITTKETEAGDLVGKLSCGLSIAYGSEDELKKAIASLQKNQTLTHTLGEKGKRAASENWNWEKIEPTLINEYSRLMNRQ